MKWNRTGQPYHLLLAISPAEARLGFHRFAPAVILLDVSAAEPRSGDASLESIVCTLTEGAPVVVVAAPQQRAELAFLISRGVVEFVARSGEFVRTAVELIEKRARQAQREPGVAVFHGGTPSEEFGELLRHEVNNPLTGILGNAELLLARRDRLPAAAIARVETIADLAVRLREIVRRLSQSCGGREDLTKSRSLAAARPAPARGGSATSMRYRTELGRSPGGAGGGDDACEKSRAGGGVAPHSHIPQGHGQREKGRGHERHERGVQAKSRAMQQPHTGIEAWRIQRAQSN